jgi:leucyl aminopeptidase
MQVFSPTGPLNRDFDDVRRIGEAAAKGIKRALQAGSKAPVLVLSNFWPQTDAYGKALEVALVSTLAALYVPLTVRTAKGDDAEPVRKLFVYWTGDAAAAERAARVATAIEVGRRIARDIGGGDPEKMAPPLAAQYVEKALGALPSVSVKVIDSVADVEREYPLAHAVAR